MPEGVTPEPDALALDSVITMNPGISARSWMAWYKKSLAALKPGIYELVVHLAYDDPEMRGVTRGHPDWGSAWRQRDFDTLRSPEFIQFLHEQKFVLVNWGQLSRAYKAHVRSQY